MAYLPKLNAKTGGGLGGIPEKKSPAGSVIYGKEGTYTFKVPSSVTSICCVCISGGRPCSDYGNSGGGLSYTNNIPVKQNDVVRVKVGDGYLSNDSSVTVNGVIVCKGSVDGGYIAGIGNFCSDGGVNYGEIVSGMGAGGYYGNASGPTVGNNGNISGSYTIIGASGTIDNRGGAAYGAGASALTVSPYSMPLPYGGGGAVKIIWGSNRSFPNNRCHNIED